MTPQARAAALAVLLALCAAPAQALDPAQAARQEMRQRLGRLLAERELAAQAWSRLNEQLQDLRRQSAKAEARAAELRRAKDNLGRDLQKATAKVTVLGQRHTAQRRRFGRRLRAMYLHGPEVSQHLLASAQSFDEALRRAKWLHLLLEADRAQLAGLTAQRRRLASLRSELAFRQNELADNIAQLDRLEKRLARLEAEQAEVLAGLAQERQRVEASIDAVREAETRLVRTFALASAPPLPELARRPEPPRELPPPAQPPDLPPPEQPPDRKSVV